MIGPYIAVISSCFTHECGKAARVCIKSITILSWKLGTGDNGCAHASALYARAQRRIMKMAEDRNDLFSISRSRFACGASLHQNNEKILSSHGADLTEREGLFAASGGSPLSGPLGDYVACAFSRRYAARVEPRGSHQTSTPLVGKKRPKTGPFFCPTGGEGDRSLPLT